jgi:quinol monooxygenase YgiN
MFIVTVTFTLDPAHPAAFGAAMRAQAANSLALEPGCLQFDVCQQAGAPDVFFLYEVYTDREAFDLHLASRHFKDFDQKVTPWVRAKTVTLYERLYP